MKILCGVVCLAWMALLGACSSKSSSGCGPDGDCTVEQGRASGSGAQSLRSVEAAPTELVKNGDFSNGPASWTLNRWGGSASGGVTRGQYVITVKHAGTEPWDIQFIQTGIPLFQGRTYTLSFDAYRGQQNGNSQPIQASFAQSVDPYAWHFGSPPLQLTTTKTRYVYRFTMKDSSDPNARIEFNCGRSTGKFYLDNVSLVESSQPLLVATPRSLDFGTVPIGNASTASLVLENHGTAPAMVSRLASSSADFTVGLSAPVSVPPAGSLTVPITWTPCLDKSGTSSAKLTISSDAADNPEIAVDLFGKSELSGIRVAPTALHFSTLPDRPSSETLVLDNSGPSAISWSISSGDPWVSVAPASGSLAAGGRANCVVTARASAVGTYSGSLALTHTATNQASPLSIQTTLSVAAGYQPTCRLIEHPEQAIDFVRGLVAFRMKQRDDTNGGYFTNIDRQGKWTGANEKALCGQSRIAYAFVRAFMLTGEEKYLEHARHALKFLYDHGWNEGWYFVTDVAGNHVSHWGHDDWWSFQQHYALVGIAAMVEATGGDIDWRDGAQTDRVWLSRGVASNYTRLWDKNPATRGYFDRANTAWTRKWNKSFAATVDALTTHALLMAMMDGAPEHKSRLVELTDNVMEHLIGNMPKAAAGFPESFASNWEIDYGYTTMDIGHGFKTAWVLQRAYLLNLDRPEYRDAAHALMDHLLEHGAYDTVYGAPFSYLDWRTGSITGRNKDFWMVEQGFASGMIGYYIAQTPQQRDRYLEVADGSLNFFLNHQMDPVYGEAYGVVSQDGLTVIDGNKGGLFTAGYHSVELGYFAYLYGSLFYQKTSVQLFYRFPAESVDRRIKLTPIAIEDAVLKLSDVRLDGTSYSDFDPDSRVVHLPPGVGGKLRVTFAPTGNAVR